LKDHQRNLTDEQLVALKENGGVIGIVFYPEFLTDSGGATISDVVDHIDHAVKIMGVDHVAIGSDFDGAELPNDIKDSSEIGKIKEALT
ncbi:membrane dipeptidase, partial [Planococcus sp. SIMBA_143]